MDTEQTRREFVVRKRVYLTDTNAEGNVYFARYFDWQGQAREDFLRQAVPDHMEILRSGTKLITVHAWLKYEHESYVFDEISVHIRTVSLKKMSMELEFTYINEATGKIIAIGGQKLAFEDASGNLITVPASIRAGAVTALIEPETEVWHMELHKKRKAQHELIEVCTEEVRAMHHHE